MRRQIMLFPPKESHSRMTSTSPSPLKCTLLMIIWLGFMSCPSDSLFVQPSEQKTSTSSTPHPFSLDDMMTQEEKVLLFGHESHDVEYQVFHSPTWNVSPSLMKSPARKRIKRSPHRVKFPSKLDLTFDAFNQSFRLHLIRNKDMFSDSFRITEEDRTPLSSSSPNPWWKMSVNESTDEGDHGNEISVDQHHCYYQGSCSLHPNSSVAISLCNGMRGLIETEVGVFVVNPLPEAVHSRMGQHQHDTFLHIMIRQDSMHPSSCPYRTSSSSPSFSSSQSSLAPNASSHHATISSSSASSPPPAAVSEESSFTSTPASISPSPSPASPSPAPSHLYLDIMSSIMKSRSVRSILHSDPHNNLITSSASTSFSSSSSKVPHLPPPFSSLHPVTVETAVFVDESLYEIMRRTFSVNVEEEILTYVMTIMNAVQLLFKQPSLGREVLISIVLMDILKTQPRDLTPSDNIDTYLTNFCVWQHNRRINKGGSTPRWDHALLLSGINMYVVDMNGRKKRQVVGLAPVSGMCNTLNSCTISEGTSFQTVLVAAHEMGHSLGMEHDGRQDGNVCNADDYIMSPTLGAGKTSWSPCSRDYLNKFLSTEQATCILTPSPSINLLTQVYNDREKPGQLFGPDQQCTLRFGPHSRHSLMQPLGDVCRLLRCDTGSRRNTIVYHAHPALEGTTCGYNKWCLDGVCSLREEVSPIADNLIGDGHPSPASSEHMVVIQHDSYYGDRVTTPSYGVASTLGLPFSTPSSHDIPPIPPIDHIPMSSASSPSSSLPAHVDGKIPSFDGHWSNSIPTTNGMEVTGTGIMAIDEMETSRERARDRDRKRRGRHPLDGVWSEWSEWTPCWSSCLPESHDEQGVIPVQTSTRSCWVPRNGGRPCIGPDKRVKLCDLNREVSKDHSKETSREERRIQPGHRNRDRNRNNFHLMFRY